MTPTYNAPDLPKPPLVAILAVLAALAGIGAALAEIDALILGIPLVVCALVMRDFRVGVILLILLMPLSASYLFPHSVAGITGLNPLNLLIAATLAACLLQLRSRETIKRLLPRPLVLAYVLPIVVAGLLGARHAGEIYHYFYDFNLIAFDSPGGYLRDMLLRPLFLVLFAFLVGAAVARSRRTESFLTPMLLAVWIMSLMTIGFFLMSGANLSELAEERARAFFAPLGMHANDLGRLYAVAYALMLFTWAGTRDPMRRLVLIASMGVVVIALTLTFSRGAFFGFIVVNALFLIGRRDLKTLIIGALLAAILLPFLPGAIYSRIETGWGGSLNDLTAGRWDGIWMPLLAESLRSPVIGNGLGSIMWSQSMQAGLVLEVTHPHNAYLQALLDMGVVGLALLCAYFVHVWRGFRSLANDGSLSPELRGFYAGAGAGLTSFLIAGLAGSSLAPVPEQTFLWLAIGMMYGQRAAREGH